MSANDSSQQAQTLSVLRLRREQTEAEGVLQRLLAEAADQVPGLSPDPTLTDPLVRLLLAAVAREYGRLYMKLGEVVDLAYEKLVQGLLAFPRAPVPSSTVLQLLVKDPGTLVGPELRVVGRKAVSVEGRSEERSIVFAPLDEVAVSGVVGPAVVLALPTGEVHLLADGSELPGAVPKPTKPWRTDRSDTAVLHLGLDLPREGGVDAIMLFLACDDSTSQRLTWATWEAGPVEDARSLVPGHSRRMQPWQTRADALVWRMRSDRGRPPSPWDRQFVKLPMELVRAGQGAVAPAVHAGIEAGMLPSVPTRCWLRVRLPHDSPAETLRSVRVLSNCVVAFNQETQSVRFAVGPEPVHVLDLSLGYRDLFRIDEIVDSSNVITYYDAETAQGLAAQDRYHLDRAPNGNVRLRLLAASKGVRPRRIEVNYTTTLGTGADGLTAGSAGVIFDPSACPGVEQAVNVSVSKGGGDAAEEAQHIDELRTLLTTRSRAVTGRDFEQLALAYDPGRVHRVQVGRGVARTQGGLGSCVSVQAWSAPGTFASELEREDFQESLQRDLQARAPAGQIVVVQLQEEERNAGHDA